MMPIEVKWDNPQKTILRQIFLGHWTGQDYFTTLEEMNTLIKQVDHRVYLIADMTASVGIPVVNLFTASGRVVKMLEEDCINITVVHAHNYFQSIVNVMRRMSPVLAERVHFVSTLEEAYTIIQNHASSISNTSS